jgi:hypothetical protein
MAAIQKWKKTSKPVSATDRTLESVWGTDVIARIWNLIEFTTFAY